MILFIDIQEAIIPVFGPRAFQHETESSGLQTTLNDITTACELFINESKNLACFQLRSPLVSGQRLNAFFSDLILFLKKQTIREMVIITGCFAHEQHTIGSTKFEYLCNKEFRNQHHEQFKENNWKEWDQQNNVIHGGGFAMKLYKQTNEMIPCCIFFKYISEGDNRSDAIDIVKQLNCLIDGLSLQNNQIVVPVSWNAMFGNDPTEQLY